MTEKVGGPGETDVMYHGPRLAMWVKGRGITPYHLPANLERAMRRWATGERATERLVDELCCYLGWGSHLTAVPHKFIVKGRKLVDPNYRGKKAA